MDKKSKKRKKAKASKKAKQESPAKTNGKKPAAEAEAAQTEKKEECAGQEGTE